jgi:hypothetical protein
MVTLRSTVHCLTVASLAGLATLAGSARAGCVPPGSDNCAQAGTAVMKAVMKEAAINAGNLQRTASPLYRRQQSAEIAAILSRDGPTSLGHCSKNEPAAL